MDQQSASSYRARTSTKISVCVLIAVAAPGFSIAATAGCLELDSREYKLMLEPDKFTGADPLKAVERFTTEQLVPALREQWNHDAAAELTQKECRSASAELSGSGTVETACSTEMALRGAGG